MNNYNHSIKGHYLSSYYTHCSVVPGVLPLKKEDGKSIAVFYIRPNPNKKINIFEVISKLCMNNKQCAIQVELFFKEAPINFLKYTFDRGEVYEIDDSVEYRFELKVYNSNCSETEDIKLETDSCGVC